MVTLLASLSGFFGALFPQIIKYFYAALKHSIKIVFNFIIT